MLVQSIATRIVAKIREAGHIAYFAGGWVRDHLLKMPSDDIDIATSASVEELQQLFPKTIPVGIAFGILIIVEEGHHFEIATFRKEREYTDGRRPSFIEKATPEEDASRRDFTINGLFFDPLTEELLDFVDGVSDLNKKIIRAIGDPHHRFLEDRLRMIRAVRYAVRFNFTIEVETEQAILSHAKSLFPSVAIERIWQEFQKMSRFSTFAKALEKLHTLDLLSVIFPSLKDLSLEDLQRRLLPFASFPPCCPLILELLHLFPESSLEEHLELADYLKLSNADKEDIRFFNKVKSLLAMPLNWQENLENAEWAYLYAHPLSDLCLTLLNAPPLHTQKKELLTPFIFRLTHKKPLFKAQDLLEQGIKPSPTLGLLLKELERLSINTLSQDKESLLKALKSSPLWPK